jgi:hypothetical protein
VITRERLPELVEQGKTSSESCLVIANSDGETMVIKREFEVVLRNALRSNI